MGDKGSGVAAPTAVEKPSTVRSFLAYMENVEYIETVEPGSNPPEGAPIRFNSWMPLGKRVSLRVHLPRKCRPCNCMDAKEAAAREVKIKHEDVKRLNELLAQMSASAKGKQAASK